MWYHGWRCTDEQLSSFPGVPAVMWPISILVEEVLQLLFLPTASGESQAAVNIMLVHIVVGKPWSLQVWIYMGLSLTEECFGEATSKLMKERQKAIYYLEYEQLYSQEEAQQLEEFLHSISKTEISTIHQICPDTAEPTSNFKQVKSCPAYSSQ